MKVVRFYVKKNTKGEKVIHSSCETAQSRKSLFPKNCQNPKHHAPGVRDKVLNYDVTTKAHVIYTLEGSEVNMYVNPANGKFWFNKKDLPTKAADQVTATPSLEDDDESGVATSARSSSKGDGSRLTRQSPVTSSDEDIAQKIIKCKDIVEVVAILETKLSQYNPRIDFPNKWIAEFEKTVQNCWSFALDGRQKTQVEMEECFFALFGYFLSRKQGSWYWQHRQQNPAGLGLI